MDTENLEHLVTAIRNQASKFSCQTNMCNFIKCYAEYGKSSKSGISRRLLIDLLDLHEKAQGLNLDDLQLVSVNKKLHWKIVVNNE